jgi:hypothetical protein
MKWISSICAISDVLFYYADSQLSSPIHKTEESFSAEKDDREVEVPHQTHLKTEKSGARLARLAKLADRIRDWEDDVSHAAAAAAATSYDVCKSEM